MKKGMDLKMDDLMSIIRKISLSSPAVHETIPDTSDQEGIINLARGSNVPMDTVHETTLPNTSLYQSGHFLESFNPTATGFGVHETIPDTSDQEGIINLARGDWNKCHSDQSQIELVVTKVNQGNLLTKLFLSSILHDFSENKIPWKNLRGAH